MREIKFRAWDEPSQSFVEDAMPHKARYYEQPLMQYTGLKDKNGKEIYEGDILFYPEDEENIVEMQDIKRPVIWERGAFRIDVYEHWRKVLDDETAEEGEIIGNIYENPELLSPTNPSKEELSE
jgi:uncharacterized phage protein (TIGR01671 family)